MLAATAVGLSYTGASDASTILRDLARGDRSALLAAHHMVGRLGIVDRETRLRARRLLMSCG
jgi:GH24 family phage-related lysozyme (muramidase)